MQILKAERGKSEVISTLINHHDSFTVCYADEPFLTGMPTTDVYLIGTEYSLDEVKNFIISELNKSCKRFYFLIVYTNLPESKIRDFANQLAAELEQNRVVDVLVTCKPD